MIPAAMPAPTQHPMHLASAGFGVARVAAAIPAAATMAVMVLGMAFSTLQGSPHPYDHTNNALNVKPVPRLPRLGSERVALCFAQHKLCFAQHNECRPRASGDPSSRGYGLGPDGSPLARGRQPRVGESCG